MNPGCRNTYKLNLTFECVPIRSVVTKTRLIYYYVTIKVDFFLRSSSFFCFFWGHLHFLFCLRSSSFYLFFIGLFIFFPFFWGRLHVFWGRLHFFHFFWGRLHFLNFFEVVSIFFEFVFIFYFFLRLSSFSIFLRLSSFFWEVIFIFFIFFEVVFIFFIFLGCLPFFLGRLSSWVKVRLFAENQLPSKSGSCLKVRLGDGVGGWVVQIITLSILTKVELN
jgi:hypothetical protein